MSTPKVTDSPSTPIGIGCDDRLECCECGCRKNKTTEIKAMGEPWKVVINCEICGSASIGKNKQEASQRFREGLYDLTLERPELSHRRD